jgi:hypothetical protein
MSVIFVFYYNYFMVVLQYQNILGGRQVWTLWFNSMSRLY